MFIYVSAPRRMKSAGVKLGLLELLLQRKQAWLQLSLRDLHYDGHRNLSCWEERKEESQRTQNPPSSSPTCQPLLPFLFWAVSEISWMSCWQGFRQSRFVMIAPRSGEHLLKWRHDVHLRQWVRNSIRIFCCSEDGEQFLISMHQFVYWIIMKEEISSWTIESFCENLKLRLSRRRTNRMSLTTFFSDNCQTKARLHQGNNREHWSRSVNTHQESCFHVRTDDTHFVSRVIIRFTVTRHVQPVTCTTTPIVNSSDY